jgi:putative ABC transport system permease protein
MSAFLAALRISRRDALRAKGRSALIMVMIGLPVLVITAVLTLSATTDVTVQERVDSTLGSADARLITLPFRTAVEQGYSGEGFAQRQEGRSERPWTPAEIGTLLQGRLLRYQSNVVEARLADGYDRVDVMEVDLRDPMAKGMRRLVEGRFAAAPGEVAVSPEMVDRGVRPGDTVKIMRPDRTVKVVGVVEHPDRPGLREMVALPEGLLPHQNDGNSSGWLADTPTPVRWADVRRLNKAGLAVNSRELIENPQGRDTAEAAPRDVHALTQLGIAVILIVMETALLAGPAFAVGMRRRRRELAVIAAQGASGRQLGVIVLADGLVLGGTAALLGAALGIGPGLLIESVAARQLDWSSGPADVPWAQVLGVAVLGLVSGLTAAIVPAVQASRQSPVQVLSGRAADARGRSRRPVLGIVLVLLGLGASAYAVHRGRLSVVAAAVPLVLGLVALMPWLVGVTGRLAGRLPLPSRLSVRDAARHRLRTASAAAAVMAATMAAVGLGIGTSSSYARSEANRESLAPLGTATIGVATTVDDGRWAALRAAAQEKLPGAELVPSMEPVDARGRKMLLNIHWRSDGCAAAQPCESPHSLFMNIPTGDERLLALLQGRRDPLAAAALAAGKAVAFHPDLVRDGMVELDASYVVTNGTEPAKTLRVPAVVSSGAEAAQVGVVIPASALTRAGLKPVERLLYAGGVPVDERRLESQLRGVTGSDAYVYVEKGYAETRSTFLMMLLAASLVLVLGGTFAATGLAAADMRQDLDTLSAVGGPPRTRKLVVAAQAAYIAGLGTLVGLAGGVVSGVALTWPLTRRSLRGIGVFDPGPTTIDVPWLFLAGVVLGLPLLAALVAGLLTRTRLVLARRVA